MSDGTQPEVEIMSAPPASWEAALGLVFCEVPAATRTAHVAWLLGEAGAGRRDLAGLFVARRGERIVGAVWAQRQPGRVASLWPPRTSPPQELIHADALLAAALAYLERGDVRLVQTLLATDATEQAARLYRHGFIHMAELDYMISLAAQFPPHSPDGPYEFVPVTEDDPARLAAVVARTYEGTLDCPALNGVRTVEDVLAGYRACGVYDPARWLVVRREGRDVGCLLLGDHPELQQWEIVYAGLVPDERGRGGGRALAREAQWRARQARCGRLVVAVDGANWPAVAMYTAAGFVVWERRSAYLRTFPATSAEKS